MVNPLLNTLLELLPSVVVPSSHSTSDPEREPFITYTSQALSDIFTFTFNFTFTFTFVLSEQTSPSSPDSEFFQAKNLFKMEHADNASHESPASSQDSFDFHFNVDGAHHDKETSPNSFNGFLEPEPEPNEPQQSHHSITLAPSPISVGWDWGPGVQGAVHSEQHSHPQIHTTHPNPGVGTFSQTGDLSLSLSMGSASQYRTNAQLLTHKGVNVHSSNPNTSRLPLSFHQNWAAMETLNPTPQETSGKRCFSLFPNGHAPQHHSPISFRPQQFSRYPYSNLSDQPAANGVNDHRGRHLLYRVGARTPQIPNQHQLYGGHVQFTQNYSTLGPPMASRMQFPPTHQLGSAVPRWRMNDESFQEESSNEVATAYVSSSSSHTSQLHQHQTQQMIQDMEISKSSEGQFPFQMNRKRARDGLPKLPIKGGIGHGKMKGKIVQDPPATAPQNPPDGRIKNSVYDTAYEEAGLPIDPHLRLFAPL